LQAPLTGQLGKPPGSEFLKSLTREDSRAESMELRDGPLQPQSAATGFACCLELGWNHVEDPRAPRRGGLCVYNLKEVIEMTDDDTETSQSFLHVTHPITYEEGKNV
jgi:hypothetical protein